MSSGAKDGTKKSWGRTLEQVLAAAGASQTLIQGGGQG